jgi:hypothetical protein
MIIIAGDSWGAGEWNNFVIQHAGLAQYLTDDGYQVVNLSRPGGSNYDIWNRLENFLMSNPYAKIEKIFVFQTEWERELLLQTKEVLPAVSAAKVLNSVGITYIDPDKDLADQLQIETANGLGTVLMLNFYQQLGRLANIYNVKFDVIGGCVDAMMADIPGVCIVCQSFVNLLINNDSAISNPVHTHYQHKTVLEYVKNNIGSTVELEALLDRVDHAETRIQVFKSNPDWFYPDGVHANRQGHHVLYKFLRENW